MRISKSSAQQIVEEIGKLVRQNINLMDETGCIVASNDPERIGNKICAKIINNPQSANILTVFITTFFAPIW